jgi:hypothetical protein
MMRYKQILNKIALKGVNRPAYIPNPTLAINGAENLSPLGKVNYKVSRPQQVYRQPEKYNADYAGFPGRGPVVTPDQFPAYGDFGPYLVVT